jgi:hypothetical protein
MDDIELPPLPEVSYVERDTASTEYGLWCSKIGPYGPDDMLAFARAAILADRARRGEPVAEVGDLFLHVRERVMAKHGPVNRAGLYLAPPPTPPADALITDDAIERACIAFSEASGFDETRRGAKVRSVAIAAALRAALEGK